MDEDQLLTTAEAAKILHIPAATLRAWRYESIGPKWFRLGPRRVMYRKSDVTEWLRDQYDADNSPA